MSDQPKTFKEKFREEMKNFLIVFLYVWAVLGLFALHKAFILDRSPLSGQVFAIINAVILGKVIVILEFLRVGKRLLRRPPLVRIGIKSIIFGSLLLIFHIVEEGIGGWFHGKTFAQTLAEIDGGKIIELVTLAVLMIIVLAPYFFLREIAAAIGAKKLMKFLLGQSPITPAAGE